MANRAGLFPIVLLTAMLLASVAVRAAEDPVATAPIPPSLPAVPLATSPPAAKATGVAPGTAKHGPAAASRKSAHPAAGSSIERKTAAVHRPSRHRKIERRALAAHTYPTYPTPRPAANPRYYAGDPLPGPVSDGPPRPPPWYNRGMPFAAYPYPGPRGPMPPW